RDARGYAAFDPLLEARLGGVDALLGGVVAAAGAGGQAAGSIDRDLDRAERAVHGLVRGRVLNGVLVADVARHDVGDALDLRNILGEERFAAGGGGEVGERPLGPLGFAPLLLAEQSYSVDQHLALLRGLHQIFQAEAARIIVAVGHHHEHLLVAVRFFLQVVDRHADGIAHGRAAARIDAGQGLFDFLDVAGEVLAVWIVQERLVIEV